MPSKSSPLEGRRRGSRPRTDATIDQLRANVSREFHDFLADIEDLIKDTTTLTGEELTQVTTKLNERVAAAKESVEQMGEQVTGAIDRQAHETATAANEYVHQEPWKAVGIGAAVGLLLGLLLARRD